MFDLVLRNARVLDPENGRDEICDVAIEDGKIAAVGAVGAAKQAIDLTGKLVMPGVIDVHTHVDRPEMGRAPFAEVASGGTVTAMDCMGPVETVTGALMKYGSGINLAVLNAALPEATVRSEQLDAQEIRDFVDSSLERGAWGVKVLGGHRPLTPDTTHGLIQAVNARKAHIALHVGTTATGSNLLGLREAVEFSRDSHLQICHINGQLRGRVLGDRIAEVCEAMALLSTAENAVVESTLGELSNDYADCKDGLPVSLVVRTTLRMLGFEPTEDGLKKAVMAGSVRIVIIEDGQMKMVSGEAGVRAFEEASSNVMMMSPVNFRDVALIAATWKDSTGRFVVDSLSNDGGTSPRSICVAYGLALVKFAALSLKELVIKTTVNPARMLGLPNKGHLGVGADGDVTVLDVDRCKPHMGIAGGKVIMKDGVVLGEAGTVITTASGAESLRRAGVKHVVADPGIGWMYTPRSQRKYSY